MVKLISSVIGNYRTKINSIKGKILETKKTTSNTTRYRGSLFGLISPHMFTAPTGHLFFQR